MHFETVFDLSFAETIRKLWPVGIYPLGFAMAGAVAMWKPDWVNGSRDRTRTIGAAFALLGILVPTLMAAFLFYSYWCLSADVASKNYLIAQGPVEGFHPLLPINSGMEHFSVRGVPFFYTRGFNAGFDKTRSNGGPIASGEYVRADYVPYYAPDANGVNTIVRLQIRR
ncbi:MAG: hypothetical protein ABSD74_19635 [Rhizomicrobium sp.]|jgi:hypothetical protein